MNAIVICVFCVAVAMLLAKSSFDANFSVISIGASPMETAVNFVNYQEQKLSDIPANFTDMPVDMLSMFQGTAYSKASSMEELKRGIRDQLSTIPEEVFADISRRAFSPHLTDNRVHFADTVSDIDATGGVTSYIGYIHTRQTEEGVESCLIVSGMQIKVGTVIAGYDEKEETAIIGYNERCFLRCSSEAITKTVKYKFPVFKKTALSYTQQLALRRSMVANAVESASSLVAQFPATHQLRARKESETKEVWSIIDDKSIESISNNEV